MNDTYEWMYIESWTLKACPRVYASCVPSYTYLESYFFYRGMQSRPAGENCFIIFAFMHGRRIKDDKVNYPLLLCGKNNEDDFPSAQKSFLPPSQRLSFFLIPSVSIKWQNYLRRRRVDGETIRFSKRSSRLRIRRYHSIRSRCRYVLPLHIPR